MKVRTKFRLSEVHQICWNKDTRRYVFEAIYDDSIPEDQRFSQATPSGTFTMMVTNPTVHAQYELGKFYYFDSTPVPA